MGQSQTMYKETIVISTIPQRSGDMCLYFKQKLGKMEIQCKQTNNIYIYIYDTGSNEKNVRSNAISS